MGSPYIWIAAAIAYGILSSAIYLWVCYRKQEKNILRRTFSRFIEYTVFALIFVRIMWEFLSE